ncbi:hypothetical protein P171DRAFT_89468 [Karstenula rhodostoma CBS 690.94]|uniref:Uncharacterized protein n=1 Tax=Karstenula rhodostoma CBS 690.94 TaxID=1392251 RepID=A0A9P4PBT8_9PLEO|nr:hypothetical protein P171DRAFT_89468 [Karstenula rhodostoma CBS 690.94]
MASSLRRSRAIYRLESRECLGNATSVLVFVWGTGLYCYIALRYSNTCSANFVQLRPWPGRPRGIDSVVKHNHGGYQRCTVHVNPFVVVSICHGVH